MAKTLREWDDQSDIDSETSFSSVGLVKAIPPGASGARDPSMLRSLRRKESYGEVVEQDVIDNSTRGIRSETASM